MQPSSLKPVEMDQPIVSFVAICMKREAGLIRFLQSLNGQNIENIEIIISLEELCAAEFERAIMACHPRVKICYRRRGCNFAQAYNYALELVQGKYISLVGADEIFYPETIGKHLAILSSDPEIDIIFTGVKNSNEEDCASIVLPAGQSDPNLARNWIEFCPALRSSVTFRSDFHTRYGSLDETQTGLYFYELFLRCMAGGGRFQLVSHVVTETELCALDFTMNVSSEYFPEAVYSVYGHLLSVVSMRQLHQLLPEIVKWLLRHERSVTLSRQQISQLVGLVVYPLKWANFSDFRNWLLYYEATGDELLALRYQAGERLLDLVGAYEGLLIGIEAGIDSGRVKAGSLTDNKGAMVSNKATQGDFLKVIEVLLERIELLSAENSKLSGDLSVLKRSRALKFARAIRRAFGLLNGAQA